MGRAHGGRPPRAATHSDHPALVRGARPLLWQRGRRRIGRCPAHHAQGQGARSGPPLSEVAAALAVLEASKASLASKLCLRFPVLTAARSPAKGCRRAWPRTTTRGCARRYRPVCPLIGPSPDLISVLSGCTVSPWPCSGASSHPHPAFRALACTALVWNRRLQVPINVKFAPTHTLLEQPLHAATVVWKNRLWRRQAGSKGEAVRHTGGAK